MPVSVPAMAEPLVPSVGLGVLHLFCAVTPGADRDGVVAAVEAAVADDLQVVAVAVLGRYVKEKA